jgi:limonene-1,2-epoxide hydrolase
VSSRLEAMRQVMAAWAAGDVQAVLDRMHDDIVWHYAAATHPPVRGKEQARKLLAVLQRDMHDVVWQVFASSETDDRLFVEGVDSYTTADGARVATPYVGVIEFSGDLITGWRDYVELDVAAAQRRGDESPAHVLELLDRPAVARAGGDG